jgi:alpha-methylacyl-CoA racemase
MNRSRPTVRVDLKTAHGVNLVLRLCEQADAIFEGFRPGVMERLGLGPEVCAARNKRLVFARMTGWGQDGPLATTAGHDTNYIALAGVLASMGDSDRAPPIPLNLIGDFGGGGAYLAIGILAAMLEASKSGEGQVVDAAMVDGAASMMTLFHGMIAAGLWKDERQSNLLDGAAPFVKTYATSDGKYVALCTVEKRFYRVLLQTLAIDSIDPADQYDEAKWPQHEAIFREIFATKSRDQWVKVFAGTDACFAPVLSMTEAPKHPHNEARKTFVEIDNVIQPAPAPRFSRTESRVSSAPSDPGDGDQRVLSKWGLSDIEIASFRDAHSEL